MWLSEVCVHRVFSELKSGLERCSVDVVSRRSLGGWNRATFGGFCRFALDIRALIVVVFY